MSKDMYYEGIGRRKTSTARVRIMQGDKSSTINGKSIDAYFSGVKDAQKVVDEPLKTVELLGKYYFTAKVSGGGLTGQIDAVKLGLARALVIMEEELKSPLRKAGFITRDPRAVERKKYNQRKARKKPQFSKR